MQFQLILLIIMSSVDTNVLSIKFSPPKPRSNSMQSIVGLNQVKLSKHFKVALHTEVRIVSMHTLIWDTVNNLIMFPLENFSPKAHRQQKKRQDNGSTRLTSMFDTHYMILLCLLHRRALVIRGGNVGPCTSLFWCCGCVNDWGRVWCLWRTVYPAAY